MKIHAFAVVLCVVSGAWAADSKNTTTAPLPPVQVTPMTVAPSWNPEAIKNALSRDQKTIFEASMKGVLKPEQQAAFWDLYGKFEKDKQALDERSIKLLQDYAQNLNTVTPKQIAATVEESSAIQEKRLKLRKSYADKISKAVGPEIGGRFYQIDDFISSAARASVLSQLPFFGE